MYENIHQSHVRLLAQPFHAIGVKILGAKLRISWEICKLFPTF